MLVKLQQIVFVTLLPFSLSATELEFTTACQQQFLAGQVPLLLSVKNKDIEKYNIALQLAKSEANKMCQCLATNLNDHFEITEVDKDNAFEQIAFSFETGNKHYMTRNLRKTLGIASVPCII